MTETLFFIVSQDEQKVLTNTDTGQHMAWTDRMQAEWFYSLHFEELGSDLKVVAREVVDEEGEHV